MVASLPVQKGLLAAGLAQRGTEEVARAVVQKILKVPREAQAVRLGRFAGQTRRTGHIPRILQAHPKF